MSAPHEGHRLQVHCVLQVVESLKQGHRAMVFVHSRKDTGKTARMLATKAQLQGDSALFDCQEHPRYGLLQKDVKKSRNRCMLTLPAGAGLPPTRLCMNLLAHCS